MNNNGGTANTDEEMLRQMQMIHRQQLQSRSDCNTGNMVNQPTEVYAFLSPAPNGTNNTYSPPHNYISNFSQRTPQIYQYLANQIPNHRDLNYMSIYGPLLLSKHYAGMAFQNNAIDFHNHQAEADNSPMPQNFHGTSTMALYLPPTELLNEGIISRSTANLDCCINNGASNVVQPRNHSSYDSNPIVGKNINRSSPRSSNNVESNETTSAVALLSTIDEISDSIVSQRKRKFNQLSSDESKKTHIHEPSYTTSKKIPKEGNLSFGYNPGKLKKLTSEADNEKFGGFVKFLREQIYVFEANKYDLCSNASGRNKPITMGQVGLVCCHCAHIPPGLRPTGAVYFPKKLTGLYQASQNMYRNHFTKNCVTIPENVRSEMDRLRQEKGKDCTKQEWVESGRRLGIIETESDLRLIQT